MAMALYSRTARASAFTAARLCLCATFAGILVGCAETQGHVYQIPGAGDVFYSPERGIYRDGVTVNVPEETLYQQGMAEFGRRAYERAAELFHALRSDERYVDGSRALDAIVLEAVATLETGRKDRPEWLLDDLANAVLDREATAAAKLRSLPDGELDAMIRGVAREVRDAGAIQASWDVTQDVLLYYTAGLGVAPNRLDQIARHGRNLAWLALKADDYVLAERIANDLLLRNPPESVRLRSTVILADTAFAIGHFERSQPLYREVYDSARDPFFRERALYGELRSILGQSKGWQYNEAPYRDAAARIAEYKANLLSVLPDLPLKADFSRIEHEINDALYKREIQAALDYEKLMRPEAAEFYRRSAQALAAAALERERTLSGAAASGGK